MPTNVIKYPRIKREVCLDFFCLLYYKVTQESRTQTGKETYLKAICLLGGTCAMPLQNRTQNNLFIVDN